MKRQSFVIVQRVNRFFEWIGLKETLHRSDHKPPFISERDLWWASLGQNVGSEVNGKSGRFSRPVLIMRKLAHGFYLVAPTTTKQREGTWYVHVRVSEIGGRAGHGFCEGCSGRAWELRGAPGDGCARVSVMEREFLMCWP